jgi:hypothetical protein
VVDVWDLLGGDHRVSCGSDRLTGSDDGVSLPQRCQKLELGPLVDPVGGQGIEDKVMARGSTQPTGRRRWQAVEREGDLGGSTGAQGG